MKTITRQQYLDNYMEKDFDRLPDCNCKTLKEINRKQGEVCKTRSKRIGELEKALEEIKTAHGSGCMCHSVKGKCILCIATTALTPTDKEER
jgi:hypothetical protein